MLESFFHRKQNILPVIGGVIFLVLLITILSPGEQTLGNSARLVYLHGALTWVGIMTYTFAAILGLASLLFNRNSPCQWSIAFGSTSLLFWTINFLLSLMVMTLIWGKIAWGEPRILMTTSVLFFSFLVFLVSIVFEKPRLIAFLNFLIGVVLWVLLIKTKLVIHPRNAIVNSPSFEIKLSSTAITLLLLAIAGLISVLLRQKISLTGTKDNESKKPAAAILIPTNQDQPDGVTRKQTNTSKNLP